MPAEAPPSRDSWRWHLGLLAVILLLLALRLPRLDTALDRLDSWRQTDTATIAENFLSEPDLLHPRINWGAPGPGYVETEFQLYPFLVHLLYRIGGVRPVLGGLLSLALTGLAAAVLFRVARRFLPPWQSGLAAVLFLGTPIVFRYSRQFMPEATELLLYLLALDSFLTFLGEQRWTTLGTAAGWMSLAILVKPTSAHLGLMLIALTLARGGFRLLCSDKLVAYLVLTLLFPLLHYLHAAHLHLTYGNTFGVLSGGDSKWGGPVWWTDPSFYLHLLQLEREWVAGGVAGGVLALAGWWQLRRRPLWLLTSGWLVAIGIYYLVAARYTGTERGVQYHIYSAVPFSLLAAAGVGAFGGSFAFQSSPRRIQAGALVLAILLLMLLIDQARTNLATLQATSPTATLLREAGLALGRLTRPGEWGVVVSTDPAIDPTTGVSNNYQQPNILYHARRKGRVMARDRLDRAALEQALTQGARWAVTLPAVTQQAASPGFQELLQTRLVRVAAGPGYEIRQLPSP